MKQRLKFYSSLVVINGLVWLYLYWSDDPNPFVVLGSALPIPILSAWLSWKISCIGQNNNRN